MEFVGKSAEGTEGLDQEPENIWVAASDGDIPRVLELLQQGISINVQDEYGYSPMHAAVSYGHKELIELLISGGADLSLRDPDGDTPLLTCEEPEIFELLVRGGSDPKARNYADQGLFEKAVEDENIVLAQYLLDNGYVDNVDPRVMVKLTHMIQGGEGDMDAIDEGVEDEEQDDENPEADDETQRNVEQILASIDNDGDDDQM
jgi:predicted nucleic acid-binding OB-fold protein